MNGYLVADFPVNQVENVEHPVLAERKVQVVGNGDIIYLVGDIFLYVDGFDGRSRPGGFEFNQGQVYPRVGLRPVGIMQPYFAGFYLLAFDEVFFPCIGMAVQADQNTVETELPAK